MTEETIRSPFGQVWAESGYDEADFDRWANKFRLEHDRVIGEYVDHGYTPGVTIREEIEFREGSARSAWVTVVSK